MRVPAAESGRGFGGSGLTEAGVSTQLIPVSSELRARAFERVDAGLNAESGIPNFLEVVGAEVLARRESIAMRGALDEARAVLAQLRAGYEARSAALGGDTAQLEETRAGPP